MHRLTRMPLLALCGVAWLTLPGFASAAAQGEGQPIFLWKTTSPTNTVHLLGSVHAARADFYPLPAEMQRAFDEAEVLVVEVDIREADLMQVQRLMFQLGMYPQGQTLSGNVAAQTMQKLRAYLQQTGMPAAAFEQFRPWAVAVTILTLEMQRVGFRPDLGIDMHFLNRAAEADKPVVELETAEAQLRLLSGIPPALQEEFLAQTLTDLPELREDLEKLATAWLSGDVEMMEQEIILATLEENPKMKPVFEKLFDERNVRMAAKVDQFLQGDVPHLVVVGAGHLVGEQGIVQLLREKGYQVEQVRTAQPARPRGR